MRADLNAVFGRESKRKRSPMHIHGARKDIVAA